MAAMLGKIPIENAMKHEWKQKNTRNSMLFKKQKYNLHQLSPPQKTHSVTDFEQTDASVKSISMMYQMWACLSSYQVICNHARCASMTKGHIQSKAVMFY